MATNLNDDFITRAFLEDVKAQSEKAKTRGVTGYLETSKRPKLRPNQRFLRKTIAGVEHSNRRAEEDEMWARRKALQRRRGSGQELGSRSVSVSSSEQGHGEDVSPQTKKTLSQGEVDLIAGGVDNADDDIEKFLNQKRPRVRGRGGIGPRIGLSGPYLDPEFDEEHAIQTRRELVRKEAGPGKPEWLEMKQKTDDGNGGGRDAPERSASYSSDESASNSSSSSSSDREARRRRRKRKELEHRKKEKEKRRKKEKRKKKKKRRKSRSKSP